METSFAPLTAIDRPEFMNFTCSLPTKLKIKQEEDLDLPFSLDFFLAKLFDVGLKPLLLSIGMSHLSMNTLILNDDTVLLLVNLLPSLGDGAIIGPFVMILPPIVFNLDELESSKLGCVVER